MGKEVYVINTQQTERSRRVLVFGGDDRIFEVTSDYHDYGPLVHVDALPGTDRDAEKAAQSIRAGKYTDVVFMRWISHPQWAKVLDAAKRAGVAFHRCPKSAKTMQKELLGYLGLDVVVAAPVPTAIVTTKVAPTDWDAVDEGMQVMPPIETLDMSEAEDVLGDASLNETPKETPVHRDSPALEKVSLENILATMQLEPEREWTAADILDILGNRKTHDLYGRLKVLIERKQIEISGGTAKSNVNPLRYRLVVAKQEKPMKLAEVVMNKEPAPPTPSIAPIYLVVIDGAQREYEDRQAALDEVSRNPSARLFKELKVKRTVTIEE
jgi:hypothetical protein